MPASDSPSVRRAGELAFLTAAGARRMEAAEEYGALRYAQAMKRLRPELGCAWEEFCGGHMVFVSSRSPVGRAHGLGFTGRITAREIERVEQFYFDHKSDAQVDVCPYADPSLFESLNQRGFQVAEFNQTLARWIGPDEIFERPNPPGMEIRPLRQDEVSQWSRLAARIFFDEQAPQFEDIFLPWAGPEHPLSMAAFVEGQMVACAGGLLVPEYRMAGFFGAGTLPEFRRRGIQSAFMQERLRLAQQAGFDLAVTLTMPDTTSQRNVERAGFRVAYTKVVVSKKHPTLANAGPAPVHYSE